MEGEERGFREHCRSRAAGGQGGGAGGEGGNPGPDRVYLPPRPAPAAGPRPFRPERLPHACSRSQAPQPGAADPPRPPAGGARRGAAARAQRGRLRARRAVPALARGRAGDRHAGAPRVAAGRPLLVPHQHPERPGVLRGGPREALAPRGVRPGEAGRRALEGQRRELHRHRAAAAGAELQRRRPGGVVRRGREALPLRAQRQPLRTGGRRGRRPGGLARRAEGGLHPRLEPLGARPGERRGDAADARRREGLRLRHRQRGLDAQRPPGGPLVARLAEGGHLPAGPAGGGRDVPGEDAGGPPGAAGLEVPAAGRQRDHHHPAGGGGRGAAAGGAAADAARPAPLHLLRRRGLRRQLQRRAVEPGRRAAGIRLQHARPQAGDAARRRRERPARCATC